MLILVSTGSVRAPTRSRPLQPFELRRGRGRMGFKLTLGLGATRTPDEIELHAPPGTSAS